MELRNMNCVVPSVYIRTIIQIRVYSNCSFYLPFYISDYLPHKHLPISPNVIQRINITFAAPAHVCRINAAIAQALSEEPCEVFSEHFSNLSLCQTIFCPSFSSRPSSPYWIFCRSSTRDVLGAIKRPFISKCLPPAWWCSASPPAFCPGGPQALPSVPYLFFRASSCRPSVVHTPGMPRFSTASAWASSSPSYAIR